MCLGAITPIVLGYMMFGLIKLNVLKQHDTPTGNYEGLPDSFIWMSGWSVAIFAVVMAIAFTSMRWKKNTLGTNDYDEE